MGDDDAGDVPGAVWFGGDRWKAPPPHLDRPPPEGPPPTGRNDPCPCGSGRKYKHCCRGSSDGAAAKRRVPLWIWLTLGSIAALILARALQG